MIFTLISKLKEKEKNTSESIRNPFLPPFEEVTMFLVRVYSFKILEILTDFSSTNSTFINNTF